MIADARGFYRELGQDLPAGGPNIRLRCFANPGAHRHEDRNPSCSVNVETGAWKCFACDAAGGPYDAALALGRSPAEAMRLLESYGLKSEDWPATNGGKASAGLTATEADAAAYAEALQASPALLTRLGELRSWTPEAIRALGVGLDGSRITFPVRGASGELVGMLRYLPNPERREDGPKLKADAGSRRELFPAPETLPRGGMDFLSEGEADSVALTSLGLPAVGVPGVNGWRCEWAERFNGREVVVLFDCDSPGRKAAERVARDLARVATVRVLDLEPGREDGFDVTDWLLAANPEGERERAQAGELLKATAARLEPVAPSPPEASEFLSSTKESETKERKTLPFGPLAEKLEEEPESPDWYWDGFLAPGVVTLLSGKPKVGKTVFNFEVIAALGKGSPFLGRPTRKVGVLVLTEERSATLRDKRYRLRGVEPHVLQLHERADRTWPEVVDEARAYCREQGLGVLVVDVLDKWAGFRADDDAKTGKMLEAVQPLLDAAGEGLAVGINGHERKAGGSHGDAVKGSNALTGSVDVILEMERGRDPMSSRTRVLRCESRFEATPDELVIELGPEGYEVLGTEVEAREAVEVRETLELLRRLEVAVTLKDCAEVADGLSEVVLRKRLNAAMEAGLAVRTGKGVSGDPHRWQILSFAGDPSGKEKKGDADNETWTPEEAEATVHRLADRWPEVALIELEPELHNGHETLEDAVLAAEARHNGDEP